MAADGPDWDADNERLLLNLEALLADLTDAAERRAPPDLELVRGWHRTMMTGLAVPDEGWIGTFRGEAGAEGIEVEVGGVHGVGAARVAAALGAFERRLGSVVETLDEAVPQGVEPTADDLAAILDVAAWAHAEWVRIHPFANGNGRTARLWANFVALRYGLPAFVRPRPRPGGPYGAAAAAAMAGDWRPTAAVFRGMLVAALAER